MASIRIRVGASVDASVDAVFPRIEKAVARARRAVESDFTRAVPAAMKKGADKAEQEFAKLAAEVQGRGAKMMAPGTKSIVDFGKAATTQFSVAKSNFNALARSMEADMRRMEAAEKKAVGGGGAMKSAVRIAKTFSPMLSIPGRIAMDAARGLGVNMDPASMVQSYVQRQSLAVDIANSGYQHGAAGAAGKRQDPDAIMREASKIAVSTGTDASAALEGLQKFVAVTGDLETGRAVMGATAKLAAATGTHLEDAVTAAGEMSAKLGDIPNKAETINALMRQIAGQGKLGAVEMRDFAKQLASVAAVAPKFGGNIGTNIGEMAIILQEARQMGGGKNAAQAATAVTAFASTFSKGARIKAFEKAGIDVFQRNSDGSRGALQSAESIILASLKKTGGDTVKMGALYGSVQARRATGGFETIYSRAGGGAKGLAAVSAEFERLRTATMSEEEVEKEFGAHMQTSAAKAAVFNAKMQETVDELSAKLLPSLEEFGPSLIESAGAAAQVLGSLAPVITSVAQSLADFLGINTTTNYDVSGVSKDVMRLNDADNRDDSIAKSTIDAAKRDDETMKKQIESDKEEIRKRTGGGAGIMVKDGFTPHVANTQAEYESLARGGNREAQSIIAAQQKLKEDEASRANLEQALEKVMTKVMGGTIKVLVTNPTGAAVMADQTGRFHSGQHDTAGRR